MTRTSPRRVRRPGPPWSRRAVGCLAACLLAVGANAQNASLLRDIHTTPTATPRSGSDPMLFTRLGTGCVFSARRDDVGRELFWTDGTPQNTFLLGDLNPGVGDSTPLDLVTIGGVCYFSAESPATGRELWRTDGTPAGTVPIRDLIPGPEAANPRGFTAMGGLVYFLLGNGSYDLWRTDGTGAGTVLVKAIGPTRNERRPVVMRQVGNTLYFGAPTLHASDGTAAGTTAVPGGPIPIELASTGATMIATDGTRLYRCAPTGVTQLAAAPVAIGDLATGGSHVYFRHTSVQYQSGFPQNYSTLWRTDGTTTTGFATSPWGARLLEVSGNAVWFQIGSGGGTTIYRNDTSTVHATLPAPLLAFRGGDSFYQSNGSLFRHVGASSTTLNLGGYAAGGEWLPLGNGAEVFAATDALAGTEPHRTDGTAAGTGRLRDLNPTLSGGDTGSSLPEELYDAAGLCYFSAIGNGIGRELWVSDGSQAGTRLVRDLEPGPGDSSPRFFAMLGAEVVFRATVQGSDGVWITDGSAAGTRLLRNVIDPSRLTSAGSHVFFQARNGRGWHDLWRTDGTPGGTVLVQALNDPYANSMQAIGRAVFYPVSGNGLWCAEGTSAPFQVVGGLVANDFHAVGDQLYFGAIIGSAGSLWRVDASGANPVQLAVTAPLGARFVEYLQQRLDRLFFWSLVGFERHMFASDGTQAGTVRLPVTHSGQLLGARIGATGGRALLRTPGQLFTSDGTAANTLPVTRIWQRSHPSDFSNWPNYAIAIGDRKTYFAESDGWSGVEMWVSDGTAAGTARVTDSATGSGNGQYSYHAPVLSNGRLLFAAHESHTGGELWQVEVGAVAQPVGSGCAATTLPPSLAADDPILGAAFGVRLQHAGANQPGLLIVGAPSPGFRHTHLWAGCTAYFDLTTPTAQVFTTDQAGRFSLAPITIPNVAGLQGARLMLQGATARNVASPIGIDLSNGVLLVAGQR